jgi:hypothetical protein
MENSLFWGALNRSVFQSYKIHRRALGWAVLLALGLAPHEGRACACGCGVFDVGTSSMLPNGPGGMVSVEYDYQDQNHNWNGSSEAPGADNPDKEIRTDFLTVGVRETFNPSWGVNVEVPYDQRYFTTTGGASGSDVVTDSWSTLGDLRVQAEYTGFSPDLSSGISFGLKLPTGNFAHNDPWDDVDRDSEIGTGTTDLLFGGYRRGALPAAGGWSWFAQGLVDIPLAKKEQYIPGDEVDAALGLYPRSWWLGRLQLTPEAQVKVSYRSEDGGSAASNPVSSGYRRILLAPGLEAHLHPLMVYADVEMPAYQHFTGDQLAARVLLKLSVACEF